MLIRRFGSKSVERPVAGRLCSDGLIFGHFCLPLLSVLIQRLCSFNLTLDQVSLQPDATLAETLSLSFFFLNFCLLFSLFSERTEGEKKKYVA